VFDISLDNVDLPVSAPSGFRQKEIRTSRRLTQTQSDNLARLAKALRPAGDSRTSDVVIILRALADAVSSATPSPP
jgi:hypothetical protein